MSRTCPNCNVGQVKCTDIPRDSVCPNCHRRVEVNLLVAGSVSIGLVALELLLFHFDLGALGLVCFGLLGFYVTCYERITTHYFPLKVYD
ncbi:MAG: hypothetical protein QGG67_17720 [Gammaproteobacteria bacterium]|jgi:hypothetical protein|nr:hypothetical protein [Gammaproteobacteria bacterium]